MKPKETESTEKREWLELLCEPVSHRPIREIGRADGDLVPPVHHGNDSGPVGVTAMVAHVDDGAAYPVVDGVPVLMRPERLGDAGTTPSIYDIDEPPFAEAYVEQSLYASLAESVLGQRSASEVARVVELAEPQLFADPIEPWFGGGSTAGAYQRAMQSLGPVEDSVVLQIGGIGTHAIKMLHAGAAHAFVVSPVIGELRTGRELADRFEFADRVTFVGGVAEELPIRGGVIDRVYSGSSLHHTLTEQSFPEIARVLAAGGRTASVDVWKARLHHIGTSMFGKAHGNTTCRPFDPDRIAPAHRHLQAVEVSFHGTSLRYPLAVGERLGLRPSPELSCRLASFEDRLALGRATQSLASLVCITGMKGP